ncbi:MAG: hypothetical protein HY721_10340 [Planctomycetes bacterium]|nr:hypothetical protein [Planctomycetota bacterium]
MSATKAPPSEVDILSRIIAPEAPGFPASLAAQILSLDFGGDDRSRMEELAAKARDGILTTEERVEMENYMRVGHFLSLLKSKARVTLKGVAPTA